MAHLNNFEFQVLVMVVFDSFGSCYGVVLYNVDGKAKPKFRSDASFKF